MNNIINKSISKIKSYDILNMKCSQKIKKLILKYRIKNQISSKIKKFSKKRIKIIVLKKIIEKKFLPYSKIKIAVVHNKIKQLKEDKTKKWVKNNNRFVNKFVRWVRGRRWVKKNNRSIRIFKFHYLFNPGTLRKKKWKIKKKSYEKIIENLFKKVDSPQFINIKYINSMVAFYKNFYDYQRDKKKIEIYNQLSNRRIDYSNFFYMLYIKLYQNNFIKIKKNKIIENYYEKDNFFTVFFKNKKKSFKKVKRNYITSAHIKKKKFKRFFFFNKIFDYNKKINSYKYKKYKNFFYNKMIFFIFFNYIKISNFKKDNISFVVNQDNKIFKKAFINKNISYWKVNNRWFIFSKFKKNKFSFPFIFFNKKWIFNKTYYSIFRFKKNINFYFFKYRNYKKNNEIRNKFRFLLKTFFNKSKKNWIFKNFVIANNTKVTTNFFIKNYFFMNYNIKKFIKNYNNKDISKKIIKNNVYCDQIESSNINIQKCVFIYNKYFQEFRVKRNYSNIYNNTNFAFNVIKFVIINNDFFSKKKSIKNSNWLNSLIFNKYFVVSKIRWWAIIKKSWHFNQNIKAKQLINKNNYFDSINKNFTSIEYSKNYKISFYNRYKKFFKNNSNQYNFFKSNSIYSNKHFFKDFFENYKKYEYLKNQKNKFYYICYIYAVMNYQIYFFYKKINNNNFMSFNTNCFENIIFNMLKKRNKIYAMKNSIISYNFSNFIKNKNSGSNFIIYNTYKKNSKNFSMLSQFSVMFLQSYLNKRSLQVIVTPKKNNAYCSIVPFYTNFIKKNSRIYHKSVGSFCKKKGYLRRSRQTKNKFFEEAAFSLLRYSKKKNRYKYLVFKIYHFYDTIRKKFKYKAHKYIKRNFFKFFQKQVYDRFPVIRIEFPKSQAPYGGNKKFRARRKKKRKLFKKISF